MFLYVDYQLKFKSQTPLISSDRMVQRTDEYASYVYRHKDMQMLHLSPCVNFTISTQIDFLVCDKQCSEKDIDAPHPLICPTLAQQQKQSPLQALSMIIYHCIES